MNPRRGIVKYIKGMILSALLIAAVFSGTAAGAAAANLPGGILIGDQDGIHVSADGEYFIDAGALEPGDIIRKNLTIFNSEPYAYIISMTAQPLEETGPLRLLDEVRCTLKIGGSVLYDGRVRGDEGPGMITSQLTLGTFQSGMQRTLEITLAVNPRMQKYYWTPSEAFFKWNFYAAQITAPEKGPKTGEIARNSLYFILPGIFLLAAILLLNKKRRNRVDAKE